MTDSSEIMVYGTDWCGASRRARLFLDSHAIPYRWVDIDLDREAASFLEKVNRGCRSVPTIIWPDGTVLVEPSNEKLAEKLGVEL